MVVLFQPRLSIVFTLKFPRLLITPPIISGGDIVRQVALSTSKLLAMLIHGITHLEPLLHPHLLLGLPHSILNYQPMKMSLQIL